MTNLDFQLHQTLVYPPAGLVQFQGLSHGPAALGGGIFLRLAHQTDHATSEILIPAATAEKNGLRPLSTPAESDAAFAVLRQQKTGLHRVTSSRVACKQTWEKRLFSGPLTDQARLLRDFWRTPDEPARGPAEQDLFRRALARMGAEIAAVLGLPLVAAQEKILSLLALPPLEMAPKDDARPTAAARPVFNPQGLPPRSGPDFRLNQQERTPRFRPE